MRHSRLLAPTSGTHYFFTTAPLPCPYFADRVERRVITELGDRQAQSLHETLTRAGFRRSHGIAYAPACPGCDDCVAVRILADQFKLSRTQRKILSRNSDLEVMEVAPFANEEQFALFSTYQNSRHAGGDMENMDFSDYQSLVEENIIDTALVEFRHQDRLVGAILIDKLRDGFSAVYSFFDTDMENRRSLGTYMILWLVQHARAQGLHYVYLGFWIDGCRKMSYKTGFQPLEMYSPQGWKESETRQGVKPTE
ncbi:MAG: arginyltransferase [Rhodospirillaceae bacterium]|nr:arginyltransferase [Rhodospirillaceae bacterium]